MKRTKLSQRKLPNYTKGEEIMNMVTHIVGGGIGILSLVFCVVSTALQQDIEAMIASGIFCISMITLYTMSSVYHGLRPGTAKKVLQILDHCTIYFLIAGTYTPIAICALRPVYPLLGWGLFCFQWMLTALAVTLTAIDLKKYNVFSMVCYIAMGWAVIPFAGKVINVMTMPGFLLILSGGIAYTLGSILYGIGAKKPWFHSVFHIFVVLGSLFHALGILLYVI